ncbi:hypothetical protein SteCoe_5439 [Stentor coeruleus]|uniref:Uncharacterized protein n=1 Tax=Stentor coeruleus TaxID=5963 RepID=A0A1R2CSD8_9CILI|nr:hypothetical protein SteCoe_5439 [Stentor coeruleus]
MGCQCTRSQFYDEDTTADTKFLYYIDNSKRIISVPHLKPVKTNKLYSSRLKVYREHKGYIPTVMVQ